MELNLHFGEQPHEYMEIDLHLDELGLDVQMDRTDLEQNVGISLYPLWDVVGHVGTGLNLHLHAEARVGMVQDPLLGVLIHACILQYALLDVSPNYHH